MKLNLKCFAPNFFSDYAEYLNLRQFEEHKDQTIKKKVIIVSKKQKILQNYSPNLNII